VLPRSSTRLRHFIVAVCCQLFAVVFVVPAAPVLGLVVGAVR